MYGRVYNFIEDLFDYKEDMNYLILELSKMKSDEFFLYFYFIYMKEPSKECLIGRDKESHIVLKEQHSSRVHAGIVYKKDNFFIYDKKSKFGTLIMNEKQKVKINKDYTNLLIGGVKIQAHMKLKSEK